VGWVVAMASFRGLIQTKSAFLRTPKILGDQRVVNALFATQWEAGIGLLCLATGAAVFALADRTPNSFFIGGLLLWQSTLYLAAPAYSLFYKACNL